MLALLCALLLRVEVLGLLHPHAVAVESAAGRIRAVAEGSEVRIERASSAQPMDTREPRARGKGRGKGKDDPALLPALVPSLVPSLVLPASERPLTVFCKGLPGPRRFAGSLTISARDGVLLLVNEAPLDDYVAGVVEAELGADAPQAAQEALAVVVRSFALSKIAAAQAAQAAQAAESGEPSQRGGAAHVHSSGAPLCDSTHCQVYKGAARSRRARKAAQATAAEVLLLSTGAVAPALHHAACGGRTAAAKELWPAASASAEEAGVSVDDLLLGPPPCAPRACASPAAASGPQPACAPRRHEPPLAWTARLSLERLRALLGASRTAALSQEEGPGGLLQRLHVEGSGSLTAAQLHARLGRALGWNTIRSPRFRLTLGPQGALLSGSGHGHGVGLCQRGAAARASLGADRHQLLARYFPLLRVGPLPRGSVLR
jgi:stage II sporulation protein D